MWSPKLKSGKLYSTINLSNLYKVLRILLPVILLSQFFIFKIIRLYQFGLMDIYFILQVIIQHYIVLFLKLFQLELFQLAMSLWDMPSSLGFFVYLFLLLFGLSYPFWHSEMLQARFIHSLLHP